jgi:hypothetical protein
MKGWIYAILVVIGIIIGVGLDIWLAYYVAVTLFGLGKDTLGAGLVMFGIIYTPLLVWFIKKSFFDDY